jgi:hypothetical protein
MYQHFFPYYQKQYYSISGYFHISLNLSLAEIKSLPEVKEWLDNHKYHIRQCPSQTDEMFPIGLLCHGSLFLHREELKSAILNHPLWKPNPDSVAPIFDIYIGDFLAAGKKTKMLFVSAERSRQEEVSNLFKASYDGTQKAYPNGANMLYIPINDGTLNSTPYRQKILYNHEKSNGDEAVSSISGLQDLKTLVKIKGSPNPITIWTLLKSLPASKGMSTPTLLKHAEPNSSGLVTMAVYSNIDHNVVIAHQATLEKELRSILENGEESKLFKDPVDGIWFGGIMRNEGRKILSHRQPSKPNDACNKN